VAVVDGSGFGVELLVGEEETWCCSLGVDLPVVCARIVDVVGGLLKRDDLAGEVQLVDTRTELRRKAEKAWEAGCHVVGADWCRV